MIKLNSFKLDKNLDSNEIYLNLKKHVDKYSSQNFHRNFISELSEILKIPLDVVDLKFKKVAYNDFNLELAKFTDRFKFLELMKNFIFFFAS